MPDQGQTRATLTVAVLTLNEEKRIRACLESAKFADQLLVVDSGSTDKTTSVAKELGAEVHTYADWQGFAVQRNRLLAHATGEYIFFLDADEELNTGLIKEIEIILRQRLEGVWRIKWRMVAFGRELKYLRSVSRVERFFIRESVIAFKGVVHEEAQLNKKFERFNFRNPLLHHSRSTVLDSLQKMTQYAILGAAKRAKDKKKGGVLRGIFSSLSIFIRVYFFNFGFMCGGAGFLYAIFLAAEAFFRYAALGYDDDFSVDIKR